VYIPSNLVSSLKKLTILFCGALSFLEKNASFSAFTSLEELLIGGCHKLILSFEPKDENSDHANGGCPWMSLNCLKKLEITTEKDLESLKLDSYTKLEELIIRCFASLTLVQGLQSLRDLRYLQVYGCPRLPLFLEHLSGQVSELFPRLERLEIDDYSFLTTSFCKHLTSLQRLKLHTWYKLVKGLTGEQDRALQLITSLQDLEFSHGYKLGDLPVGLHSLSSLKRLRIIYCQRILKLPEKGLPPSLEELEISDCSEGLTTECRMLATSVLKVKIDGHYVN
jgi:hypothetical protein